VSAEPGLLHFEGPCPFLGCLDPGPHDHPVCPDCGAVRYGNPFYCPTCEERWVAARRFEVEP
jgi:hypothetical protein